MPKEPRVYFAVRVGRKPGIYTTWEDCREQVHRYPHAVFKKMKNLDEAEGWINEDHVGSLPAPEPVQRGAPHPTTSDEPAGSLPSLSQTSHSTSSSSTITPTPTASLPYTGRSNAPLKARAGPLKHTGPSSSSTVFENVVYTDGACSRNGQAGSVAGIGVWWGPSDPRNLSERCPGDPQTNNRAELIAIIRALETAQTSRIPLVIKSDSKYAIKCINTWLPAWRKRGFRTTEGTRVKNSELVMYADALISRRKQAGQKVVFQHVPGHAGEPGNEGADALAVHGCKLREADARNWGDMRHKLEKSETVDASIFADMVLDSEQLLAELEEG